MTISGPEKDSSGWYTRSDRTLKPFNGERAPDLSFI